MRLGVIFTVFICIFANKVHNQQLRRQPAPPTNNAPYMSGIRFINANDALLFIGIIYTGHLP